MALFDSPRKGRGVRNSWTKVALLAGAVAFVLIVYAQVADVREHEQASGIRRFAPVNAVANAVASVASAVSFSGGGSGGSLVGAGLTAVRDTFPEKWDFCDDRSKCGGPLKVIATSLYGGAERYCHGTVRNSEIAKEAFPDWQLWVYVPSPGGGPAVEVPKDITDKISSNGATVVQLDNKTMTAAGFGMNWRFLVADNKTVDRFIIRDGDSRLLVRDRLSLDEWEASDLPYHVARDHPSHNAYPISGGMWGAVKEAPTPPILEQLSLLKESQKNDRVHDMDFLNNLVWPIMQKAGVRQHDAFSCSQWAAGSKGNSTPFPIPRGGGEHVGAVYLSADISRAGDLSMLPPRDTCAPPNPAAAARSDLRLAVGDDSTPCVAPCALVAPNATATFVGDGAAAADVGAEATAIAAGPAPLLASFELKYKFIDAATTCPSPPSGAKPLAGLPTIFDHTTILRFGARRYTCPPISPASVPQYHERIPHPRTHYDVFRPDGMKYYRLLFVVDAALTDDPRHAMAEGLPALVGALARMPPYARILLRDSAGADAAAAAAARHGLAVWQGATLGTANLTGWRTAPWSALHRGPPSLSWAYRMIVITSAAPPLAALPEAGPNHIAANSSPSAAADADAAFAAAAHQLAAAPQATTPLPTVPAPTGCVLALLGDGPKADYAASGAAVPGTGAWNTTELADGAPADDYVDALRRASVVVVRPETPPLYLGLARRGATIVFAHAASAGTAPTFPKLCGLGTVRCVNVPSGARAVDKKAVIEEVLSSATEACSGRAA